jgi:hypothetical protein
VWSFEHSVDQYNASGGTGREAVNEQITLLRAWLARKNAAAATAAAEGGKS